MSSKGFSSVGMQLLSSLISFLGITVLTHCLSRRLSGERVSSFSDLRQMPWPRLCLLLVFLDSWLFVFSSGILIFGVGLELNHIVCSAAIELCIAFYATTKLLVYFFLIERVHIVWSPVEGISRLKSPVDIICFITVSLYAVIIALMIAGRSSMLRSGDDTCIIGLKSLSSIPLIAYDAYTSVLLTGLFLWPILKNGHPNQRVRRVARRALLASLIALITSAANIGFLFGMKGHELGWVCLGSCGVDVILNSYTLFWATSSRPRPRNRFTSISDGLVSKELHMFATKQPPTSSSFGTPAPDVSFPQTARSAGPQPTVRQNQAPQHHGLHFHLPHFSHLPHLPHLPHFHHLPHLPHLPHFHHRPPVPHVSPNPFARPVFVPRSHSEVRISANPELAEKPPKTSVFQSLADLFREERPAAKLSHDSLQVTVTTHLEIEHEEVTTEYGLPTIHETV